jgi:hypothetical protein
MPLAQPQAKLKRRHQLPPWQKLSPKYTFDIDKILAVFQDNFDELKTGTGRDFIAGQCDRGYSTYEQGNYNLYNITDFDENFVPEYNGVLKKLGGGGDKGHRQDPRWDERKYVKLADWAKGTYIEEVLNTFEGQASRCNIRVMGPGSSISEHMDYDTTYSMRYHIPLLTNEQAYFTSRRRATDELETFRMPADGSTYFLNQGILHSAYNDGDTPRIHMMVCVNGQQDLQLD